MERRAGVAQVVDAQALGQADLVHDAPPHLDAEAIGSNRRRAALEALHGEFGLGE